MIVLVLFTVLVAYATWLVVLAPVFSRLRCKGWGWLSLDFFSYSWTSGPESPACFAEWTLCTTGVLDRTLHHLLRNSTFAISAKHSTLSLDQGASKIVWACDILSIVLSPPSAPPPSTSQDLPSAPGGMRERSFFTDFSKRLIPLTTRVVSNAVVLLTSLFCLRIRKINIIFAQFPHERNQDLDFWNALQITMKGVRLLDSPNSTHVLLQIDSLIAEEISILESSALVFSTQVILNIPKIHLSMQHGNLNAKTPSYEWRLTSDQVLVDLWPCTVLLLASAFSQARRGVNDRKSPVEQSDVSLFSVVFPGLFLFSGTTERALFNLHLPISKPELQRFEAMTISIDGFFVHACLEPTAKMPLFLASSSRVNVSSRASEKFGSAIRSKVGRLFDGAFGPLEGMVEDLLSAKNVILANCCPEETNPCALEVSDQSISRWVQKVLQNHPPWAVSSQDSDYAFDDMMKTVKTVSSSFYSEVASCLQPFTNIAFKLLPKTIAVRLDALAFDVPFEYPLSNLFDHLVMFVKIAKAPFVKTSNRQAFNPFVHTWRLLVSGEDGRFSIADDPFEVKLQKSFQLKQKVWKKFARLEKLFWLQCKEDKERLGLALPSQDRWVPLNIRNLAKASEHAQILYANPLLASRYVKLQEKLFDIYRAQALKNTDPSPALLKISVCDADFAIRWNPEYTAEADMAKLLNAVESDNGFTMDNVREFGLLLGGFVDFSGSDLKITIRDSTMPLGYSKRARLAGLAFLVEQESYLNAVARDLVKVIENHTFPGVCNLIGVDRSYCVAVHRTILPIKIFHSLQLSAFGECPAVAGFSPLIEGPFHMLDRAFELFSKPSEELSPFLPFWDKLRLLLRGASSSLAVSCPCRIVCIKGTSFACAKETLALSFPRGFFLGLDDSKVKLRVPEATAFIKSAEESILQWLHQTVGKAFAQMDSKLCNPESQIDRGMPIITFPKVEIEMWFQVVGFHGKTPIAHNAVKICAASNMSALDPDYDSYRQFRSHGMSITIKINATRPEHLQTDENCLMLYYYRELEKWFFRNFCRHVCPPVKAGKLFELGTLSKTATPKIASVLNQVHFELCFEGFCCARALHYFDDINYRGLLLCSSGRTRVSLFWKRSDNKIGTNHNYGRWFLHFGEADLAKMRLAAITSDKKTDRHLHAKGLPLKYEGVGIFDIISAPRLFYVAINQACFKYDSEASNLQRRVIEARIAEIGVLIEDLARKLRMSDPTKDMRSFTETKHQLSVLLEQNDYISSFLKEQGPSKDLVSNHQFIIQNALLLWNQDVRDATFAIVDQQFQFSRLTSALQSAVLRTIFSKMGEVEQPSSFLSPASSMAQRSAGEVSRDFFDFIMMQDGPIDAGPESSDNDENMMHSEMADPVGLEDFGMRISKRVDVNFVNPQIILLDTSLDAEKSAIAALIITAQSANLKYGTIRAGTVVDLQMLDEDYVGLRTKIVLENARMQVAFRKDFKEQEWPPIYPIDCLLGAEAEMEAEAERGGTERFQGISERARAVFVYDVSNQSRSYGVLASPIRRVFGRGDKLRVDTDTISLMTTSAQYAVLYDVILNLLVYRDPAQKTRNEQLESLILATNIFEQQEIVHYTMRMQHIVTRKRQVLTERLARYLALDACSFDGASDSYMDLKVSWDELALVIDAVRTVRANEAKIRQKQTLFLLDVIIEKIKWSLLQSDESVLCDIVLYRIHDSWLSSEDGSQSNLIEIQAILGTNRQPKAFYRTLIAPVPPDIKAQLCRVGGSFRGIGTLKNSVRFFFKALPPVSGIRIIEHAELNLAPLQFQLTYNIGEEVLKFFFPSHTELPVKKKSLENINDDGFAMVSKYDAVSVPSSLLSRIGDKQEDFSMETMKARASENCTFIYVNVPASQHLISYKGRGDTSITDVDNFILKLPDFEYHSQIWSWLEFFLQLRRDSVKVVVSNIGALVREKIKRLGQANQPETENEAVDQEQHHRPAGTTATLSRTPSRLNVSQKKADDPDSPDNREHKAKLLLGKMYNK